MNRVAVNMLRALIVVVLVSVTVALFWFVPWVAGLAAEEMPEFASLRVPLLVLVELALACVVVVALCLWQLLSLVSRGTIFDRRSLRWVSPMIYAATVAAACCLLAELWIPGPPVLGLMVLVVALLCLGLALVLTVMRGLLIQAVSFRAELSEVI